MSEQHTKKPWQFDRSGKYYGGQVIRHNGQIICKMVEQQAQSPDELQANGDLIAAAPELLTALISCQFELQMICEDLIRESTTHAQLASLTQAKAAIHKVGHLSRIEAVLAETRPDES